MPILLIFFYAPEIFMVGLDVELPGARNFDFQEKPAERLPEINIERGGRVLFDERVIVDLDKLPLLIEEKFEEIQCDREKVLLKADREVPFGRVREVLACIKKAYIGNVSLMIERY